VTVRLVIVKGEPSSNIFQASQCIVTENVVAIVDVAVSTNLGKESVYESQRANGLKYSRCMNDGSSLLTAETRL